MDQKKHWNKIAPDYEDQIFDVFQSDKNKVLKKYFSKHANPAHQAIDFGCGTGKAFPYLSPAFKEVLALDISSECLKQARGRGFSNIRYKQADLSRKGIRIPPADFLFCCNVIMLPEIDRDLEMFRNIARSLRPGGNTMIVVPSLESVLFSSWRMMDWYGREGVRTEKIPAHELAYFKADKRSIIQGIIHIDGVPTKHYSEQELYVITDRVGLTITALERIEYDWNTEFDSPPSWMKAPYPWDWMIECRK
ncbi:MAG: class I SAM-dependent methyltransferase [Cyclobacteriaceae bacterium]|nr:class I SAM-dependent methyltransferase [Cyclobacteriaceae bacterium]